MTTTIHSVKVTFGEDIRRFGFEGFSFSNLEKDLHLIYQLPPMTQLCIKFQDDESEWITVSSDLELSNAFEIFPNGPLRISFSIKEQLSLPIVQTTIPSLEPLYPMIQMPSVPTNDPFPMDGVRPTQNIPKCGVKKDRRQKKWERKAGKFDRKLEKKAHKHRFSLEVPAQISWDLETCLAQLLSLGFADRVLNERLLKKCKNDVHRVVWELTKIKEKEERKLIKIERKIRKLDCSVGSAPIVVCG